MRILCIMCYYEQTEVSVLSIFMVTPCINIINHFIIQLITQLYKSYGFYKRIKNIKAVPTCFCSHRNHLQGACVWFTVQEGTFLRGEPHTRARARTHAQQVGICRHNTDHVLMDKHSGTISVILAKHLLWLPEDGSCVNRNMSE